MKEQVIELAKQAGFHFWDAGFADKGILHTTGHKFSQKCFERFARLVRNAALEDAKSLITRLDNAIVNLQPQEAVTAIEALKEPTP